MPLDYERLCAIAHSGETCRYNDKDAILYALSTGFAGDPANAAEMEYVCECLEGRALKTVPTLATVLVRTAGAIDAPGINRTLLVHGEQRLRLERPLPAQADLLADTRVADVFDKGKDKGALLVVETALRLRDGDVPLATSTTSLFLRGDGGFGGAAGPAPQPHPIPERAPDLRAILHSQANQALLYRLNGDRNPLHVDADFARRAGFKAPILHGLCSYGIACRGVLQHVCDYDHRRIRAFDARFAAPVFAGDALAMEFWRDGTIVSFRLRREESGEMVINNGKCILRD